MQSRSGMIAVVALWMLSALVGCAGDKLSSIPSDPKAKILLEQTFSVPAKAGTTSDIVLPAKGIFAVDFAVEAGKELTLKLITGDQMKAILAGRQATGSPLMDVRISGTASQTIMLDPGHYVLAFLSNHSSNVSVVCRATYRLAP